MLLSIQLQNLVKVLKKKDNTIKKYALINLSILVFYKNNIVKKKKRKRKINLLQD